MPVIEIQSSSSEEIFTDIQEGITRGPDTVVPSGHSPLRNDSSSSDDGYSWTEPCPHKCGLRRGGWDITACPNKCRLEKGHEGHCECMDMDTHIVIYGLDEFEQYLTRCLQSDQRGGDLRTWTAIRDFEYSLQIRAELNDPSLGTVATNGCDCFTCLFVRCGQYIEDLTTRENCRFLTWRRQSCHPFVDEHRHSLDGAVYSILRMAGIWQSPLVVHCNGKLVVARLWDKNGHIRPRHHWWLRLYTENDYDIFKPDKNVQRWLVRFHLWSCFKRAAN